MSAEGRRQHTSVISRVGLETAAMEWDWDHYTIKHLSEIIEH